MSYGKTIRALRAERRQLQKDVERMEWENAGFTATASRKRIADIEGEIATRRRARGMKA